jgi:hypothetical protein
LRPRHYRSRKKKTPPALETLMSPVSGTALLGTQTAAGTSANGLEESHDKRDDGDKGGHAINISMG